MNPLERSIAAAIRANEYQRRLFGRMGNSDHPRGAVLSGYRNARRSMSVALKERFPLVAARDVMTELRSVATLSVREIFQQGVAGGIAEATLQLGYYDIQVPENAGYMDLYSQVNSATDLIGQNIDLQASTIYALIAGGDPGMVLGSEDRLGVLKPGDVLMAGAFWTSTLMWNSFADIATRHGGDQTRKQAIAAIDGHTTNCCLLVHGQIANLDGMFHLNGTPRYADRLEWCPFHWYCRTSVALYQERYDDGITERLRESAGVVLSERKHGIDRVRWPADAYS